MEIDLDFGNSRGNDGCGCLVYGVLGVVFAVSYVVAHARQIRLAVIIGVCVFCGVVVVREVLRRIPPRRSPASTVAGALPTPLAEIKPGIASVAGLVGFSEQPRNAPLGAPHCVFYRVLVSRFDDPDKVVFESRSADAITLEDGAGAKVVVQLDGAKWRMTRFHRRDTGLDPSGEVAQFLAERGVAVTGPMNVRVEWIAPHELVFVRGLAKRLGDDSPGDYRTTHEAHFEMAAAPDHPLTISLEP